MEALLDVDETLLSDADVDIVLVHFGAGQVVVECFVEMLVVVEVHVLVVIATVDVTVTKGLVSIVIVPEKGSRAHSWLKRWQ